MNYSNILVGNLLLICFKFGCAVDTKDKPPFIFKKFENCNESANYAIKFKDITMDQSDKNKFIMNGLIEVAENLGPEVIGRISANHCKDVNNPDSCEYLVQDYDFGDVCDLITDKDGEWQLLMEHIQLPSHCPIPTGTYKIDHFESVNAFDKKLPVPEGLWKVEISCYVDDVIKGCAYIEALM